MCISCLLLSTLMVFTPAQATEVAPGTIEIFTYNQESSSILARETQAAIASLLNKLPDSSELKSLREELNSFYTKLSTAKDDTQADEIINKGVQGISDRIMAEPNPGKVRDVLFELREAEFNEVSPNVSSLHLLEKTTHQLALLSDRGSRWGWLS